ncbi:hypothetical protein ABT301_09935 [Streptomyces sp. NPDC000987]|uniref:hypothetical protein n=1 Tax=Streptomyces sp. NPDC000987 TaxID=3154374 RepID=UPI0033300CCF
MTADSDRAPTPAGDGEPTRALGPADPEYSATVLSSQWIQRPEPDDATLLAPEPDDATLVAPPGDADVTVVAPPMDVEATVVLPPGDADETVVVPPTGVEATVVLPPGDADETVVVPPTGVEATVVVPPTGVEGTVVVPPTGVEGTVVLPPGDADETVVAPSAGVEQTVVAPPTDADETVVAPSAGVAASTDVPDRTEGTVLRFGPGVTAAVAHRTSVTLAAVPPPPAPPRRRHRLRRHALPALVLLCVLAFLAWQRLGPSVAVRTVEVASRPAAVGCDATADVVGVVTTNGRAGSLSYRWTRSDGTASGVLREQVARGQRQARLHLLWSFQGKGRYTARAELHLLTPTKRTVATSLTYDCR